MKMRIPTSTHTKKLHILNSGCPAQQRQTLKVDREGEMLSKLIFSDYIQDKLNQYLVTLHFTDFNEKFYSF